MAALGFVVNIDSLLLLGNQGSEVLLAADSPFRQKYVLTDLLLYCDNEETRAVA